MSSIFLAIATIFAAFGAAAHADYRASGNPGGVLSPNVARFARNAALVLATVLGCVGASLKVGGF
jgi:hypothetical protein